MKQVFTIGIAGAVGALLRTMIGQFAQGESGFPIGTWAVNVVATFLLCLIAAGVLQRFAIRREVEEAITVGFLGSFSTFSALSIETVLLVEEGTWLLAGLYVVISLIGGLMAGTLGFSLGRKWMAHDNA